MGLFADIASVVTAVIAAIFFLGRFLGRIGRSWRLRRYLKLVRAKQPDTPMRSVIHLKARLGITEDQVFIAALDARSKIFRGIRSGGASDPLARDIMFQYDPKQAKHQDQLL